MFDVIKTQKIWFTVSAMAVVLGLAATAVYGLNLGIDFKGGSISEIKFENAEVSTAQVQEVINQLNLGGTLVQNTDQGTFIIRTPELTQEQRTSLNGSLQENFGNHQELRFANIGPTISGEVTRRAFYQLILVSLGILAYIAWAFRRVPKPLSSWRFGWAAIIALVHDLAIVVGVFAVLGKVLSVEIDALFVTALLTILGFSVHDTIIIFDRVRENLRRLSGLPFAQVVAKSINQTIVRSINTSTTVIFVLLALLLFGGETLRYFVLALLIGIAVGTYSSIFIASPLLYVFHRKRFTA